MKKNDVAGLIVGILLFGVAVTFVLLVLAQFFNSTASKVLNNWQYILFMFGAGVSGILLNSIVFELAHVVGAAIGGYKILSVNILYLQFSFKEKFKVKFANFDGLTGATVIVPKEKNKKEANPIPYLLFGTLFFIIELLVLLFFFFFLMNIKESETIDAKSVVWYQTGAYFLLTMIITGALILTYNIIPIRLDSVNDGYRLKVCSKKKNIPAFNDLLRAEQGIKVEHSEEDIQKVDRTIFSTDIRFDKYYELLTKENFTEALAVLDEQILVDNKISKKVYSKARNERIYVKLMTLPLNEALEFYDSQVPMSERREISNDSSIEAIKAYVLMSGLLDKSQSECILALKRVKRALSSLPDERKELEKTLLNKAIEKVLEAHQGWEIGNYKQ